jgi:hypothetical protein
MAIRRFVLKVPAAGPVFARKQRRNRMQQPSHDSSPAGQQMEQQDGRDGVSPVSFAQQGSVEGLTGSVSGDAKTTLWKSLWRWPRVELGMDSDLEEFCHYAADGSFVARGGVGGAGYELLWHLGYTIMSWLKRTEKMGLRLGGEKSDSRDGGERSLLVIKKSSDFEDNFESTEVEEGAAFERMEVEASAETDMEDALERMDLDSA